MNTANFETLGPVGLGAITLAFGTFFLSLYLMSREKRKLMLAISFILLSPSYLDMALAYSPYSGYRTWSHIPFMAAFTIAMSERLLQSRIDFDKLFSFFVAISLISLIVIPLKIVGMDQTVMILVMTISSLFALLIIISIILQIFRFKDRMVVIGIPAVLSLFCGGFLLAFKKESLFYGAHYFAFLFMIPILIYATGVHSGKGRGLSGYFSLYTQLETTRAELEGSEKKFRMIFNNAREAMIWMKEDGRIINFNWAAREMFHPLNLKGLDLYSLFVKQEKVPSMVDMRKELKKKKDFEGEFVIRIGKKKIPVSISAVNTMFKDEMITQFIISDISARKDYEKRLEDTNMKLMKANIGLKHSDRIKTEFISILSHDIINPLTATRTKLQLMEEGVYGKISENQKDAIKGIIKNLDSINNIRQDTVEITRLGSINIKKEINHSEISELLEKAVQNVKRIMQTDGFEFVIEPDPPVRIRCNTRMVERALENLLTNAVRYSKPGSKIEIGAREENGNVVIHVKDRGRGIPEEELEPIFERFYRTGERIEGSTGLGLSIVKSVALSHGGQAWAESEGLGKGSTFFLKLPKDPK